MYKNLYKTIEFKRLDEKFDLNQMSDHLIGMIHRNLDEIYQLRKRIKNFKKKFCLGKIR